MTIIPSKWKNVFKREPSVQESLDKNYIETLEAEKKILLGEVNALKEELNSQDILHERLQTRFTELKKKHNEVLGVLRAEGNNILTVLDVKESPIDK